MFNDTYKGWYLHGSKYAWKELTYFIVAELKVNNHITCFNIDGPDFDTILKQVKTEIDRYDNLRTK